MSLCFDNSAWKWPGIINVVLNWENAGGNPSGYEWLQYSIDRLVKSTRSNPIFDDKYNTKYGFDEIIDICKYLNDTFSEPHEANKKDFFLKLSYQIENVLQKWQVDELIALMTNPKNSASPFGLSTTALFVGFVLADTTTSYPRLVGVGITFPISFLFSLGK